ncbi:CCR4-NOT transcription complex subunit 4 [Entomortierella parvispora]|uniref:CCR4-NOT transcription complex subunit 4 n=1 Tax=Entomortierella parvispora TaxID=205924 RepID=A0A9P3LV53_9FUNG|nr:CCR4-NOT transcription complex subunit 4 [Entomortierella parvispora]
MMSDEEDFDCPLCMEELDISDRNFRPCPCGYQICRFCWHHIKENLNGRCPACRRVYSEETVEFTPISADELAMIKNEKKAKEREKKEMEAMNRKHLSNMRVVQKSLVYVIGLPTKLANDEHTLRQHEYFGQYGKISKVVINRRNAPMPVPGSPGQPSVGVYITYVRKEDAAKAIAAIDGSIWDGKILRASYGTTKYCTYYLRGMACQNPGCMYLHEPGEDADSYTKEDLATGKHHLQDHMGPYDPYSQKPAVLGRPSLTSQSSSSTLTPRPKPATVASYHSASSSLSDWPAPGERPSNNDDKDDEGSALPATASWAKIGSNPSTPTLMSSTLARRTTEPPPLRSKGSTTSIITGVVVNNGKKKEPVAKDTPELDYAPTPAEALAIEAAAKERMFQEQRQLQEQQRKQQQDQPDDSLEQQTEVLNRKLRKQRMQEQEQERLEQERLKQQQEMEQKLQSQKEKDQKKLQDERDAKERKEKEEKERLEQERKELEEQERRLAQSQADLYVSAPPLSLGSFSFNPDATLSTLPLSFGGTGGLLPLGSESGGAFGLDSFSAFANMPLTPGHYTGSFNPFSMDDEPLMRRSMAQPARSFLDDVDYDPTTGRNRPVGPPIPGKPRQTSRFGFAMEGQQSEAFGLDGYADSQSMQDGFRALFPNVNVSFGAGDAALNLQQQQQLQQQQFGQQQQQFQSSPSLRQREEMSNSGMWGSAEKQDAHMFQRSMSQLNMDPILTTPSSRMAEYHQQLHMQQQHSQRGGPPGIARGTINPAMVKSPPPGLESVVRTDGGQWSGSQHQQQQQQRHRQQSMSRVGGWGLDNSNYLNDSTPGANQENNHQDFFSSFLKAAAASPQSQPATLSQGSQGSNTSFQDPAIMTARMSSAGLTRSSLVEALQNPSPVNGMNGYKTTGETYGQHESTSDGPNRQSDSDRMGSNESLQQRQQAQQLQRQSTPDSPSSLQNFPLGSKRKEIKSVKGVLNSGMNAPLSGGSRSRPSSTPGSPLVEPRLQLHQTQQQHQQQQQQMPSQQPIQAFGAGESPMMNAMTLAAARSAKVKSDLLMGLNSPGIRSDRFSSSSNGSKDASEATSGQLNGMANGFAGSKTGVVSGPPPGLGLPSSSMSSNANNPSNSTGSQGGDNANSNSGSPYMMSNGLSSYGAGLNSSKPMDVASMMSALDFFGPGGSAGSSAMGSPNWASLGLDNSYASGQHGGVNGGHMQHWSQSPSQGHSNVSNREGQTDMNGSISHSINSAGNSLGGSASGASGSSGQFSPSLSTGGSGANNGSSSVTARSVEDLEQQVFNAKKETQMLENQLNAVIKRNRRKIYA